ncbi:hypothetical protein I6F35_15765 [Bradyrhizobium sp. BRP22]|uniref:hypothetical protein n=1 Tax=Bradyrhizobium sp. BRP22 TaxID=2793821 RepID=UPI001CD66171|nr:hypothetical protein [Bradyrhizobium sp. BRP22]MCA1454667.1 hypothetical protein [Bradyrhizobium sp. BRP22]
MPSFSDPIRAKIIVIFAVARLRWRRGILWPAENDLVFKAVVISLGIFSSLTTAIVMLYL